MSLSRSPTPPRVVPVVIDPSKPGPKTRRTARNLSAMAAAEVAGKAATLAYTVVAARVLSPEDFGAFAFAIAFSLLVATLPSWGFDALLVQRASAEPDRLPVLFSETMGWRLALIAPVFIIAGMVGVALRPTPQSGIALLLVLSATMVDLISDAGRAAAGARQDLRGVSRALVFQRFVTAGLAVSALLGGLGLVGLSAAYLIGALAGGIAVLVSVHNLGVRLDLRSVHREGLLETGRRSVVIGLDVLVAMALFRVDQVILGAIKGDEAVAIYAASYRLLETVLFVSWVVSRSVFPVMSENTEGWRLRRAVEKGTAAASLLFVPFAVGLWLEARPVLQLLYGSPYADTGVAITRWLAPSPIFFLVGFLGSFALFARERRMQVLVASLIAAAYNVGLNLVLIPRISGLGAAIATTTSYALEAILTLLFLLPITGLVRLDKAVALPAVASLIMAAAVLLVPGGLLVDVPVGIAVFGTSWYLLARWRSPEQLVILRSVLHPNGRGPST
jgi:O-antigen/teichoic acid export membrane protein